MRGFLVGHKTINKTGPWLVFKTFPGF